MKICIVGAGAIGGVLGYRLAAAGHEVCLIARGAHLEAIRKNGLTLVDHLAGGARGTLRLPAASNPAELARDLGAQDALIITQKAHDIPPMLPLLAPLMNADTVVVPVINGLPWWYFWREGGWHDGASLCSLDPAQHMFAELDCARILGGIAIFGAEVQAPGEVHHTTSKAVIIGEIDRSLASKQTARAKQLHAALQAAGMDAKLSADVRVDVWNKLIGNMGFNPVSALSFATADRFFTEPELFDIVRRLMADGTAIAASVGVTVSNNADQMWNAAQAAPGKLAQTKVSMHQDFERHRRPEIAAILGAPLELADEAGLEVPTLRMIHALVRARAVSDGIAG